MTLVRQSDPLLRHAIEIIKADYGDTVSLEAKNKDLIKFGSSETIQTTRTTIMTLPSGIYNETYVSTNAITTISSSSASDTQSVVIEGHTISGGLFTFISQTVTLNGQTQVALTTPLARANRIYNDGTTNLVGNIYVYETGTSTAGVPDTAAAVHIMIQAGFNNSEKAATTISNIDYWIVTHFYGDVIEKSSSWAQVNFEIRREGKVFRNVVDRAASDQSSFYHKFEPYLIVPKNSDVRLTAFSNVNNVSVSGGIGGFLVKVI